MNRFLIIQVLFFLMVAGCDKHATDLSDNEVRDSVTTPEDSLSEHDESKKKIYSQGGLKFVFESNNVNFDTTLRDRLAQLFFDVYPKIRKRFNKTAAEKIIVSIDKTDKKDIQTIGNVITFGGAFFQANSNDIDELTHQLAYVVLEYSNDSPAWLVQGIANYVRYTYGVQNEEEGWGLPKYNADQKYSGNAMVAARFLVWLENNIDSQIVDELCSLISQGAYESDSWRKITWRTLDDLWQAYSNTPDLSLSKTFEEKTMAQVAKRSFAAFNYWFYDKNKKLYYLNTTHSHLASGWTQAAFWNIVMDAYEYTKNPRIYAMINDVFEGGMKKYSNFHWEDVKYVNGWIYDDMMWWVDAMARAYRITNNSKFLNKAIAGFDFVWKESYDPVKGGMKWSWKVIGKNACVNYPTVIGAMRLYNITGEEKYFTKAKEIYAWSRDVFFQESTGRVADHKVGNDPVGFEDYTYNQGTCIGSALLLYKATGKTMYLEDAKKAANYTVTRMCNKDGILPAEKGEGGVFKYIFIHYMKKLVIEGKQYQYFSWVEKNAKAAWGNRDVDRDICFTDYTMPCPTGTVSSYSASSAVKLLLSFVTLKEQIR